MKIHHLNEKTYDISELEGRLKALEELLRQALHPEPDRTRSTTKSAATT